ncbi:hypothetical protein [Glutamicibacter arilaitensis]
MKRTIPARSASLPACREQMSQSINTSWRIAAAATNTAQNMEVWLVEH